MPARSASSYAADRARGFTLVEVMIAVVIVGILASVALPAYQSHVADTRRAEGKQILLATAQRLERCYTVHGSYADDDCGVSWPVESDNGHYRIDDPDADLSADRFTLEAAPRDAQAGDDCGTLTLTETGAKGIDGASAGSNAADCW